VSRAVVTADLIRTRARMLRMPGLARSFESLCRQADKERWSFEELLAEGLAVEVGSRSDSAVRQRLRDARFPDTKTLDQFDFAAADGVDAAVLAKLARVDWIERKENVVFAGPVGTGKTHLAIALGVEAAKQRRRVAFVRAADLVRQLVEARDARELGRLQRRFDRVDLLILDEVGFVPFQRDGGELLFNLIAHRYERRSLLVTTNLPFAPIAPLSSSPRARATACVAAPPRPSNRRTRLRPRARNARMPVPRGGSVSGRPLDQIRGGAISMLEKTCVDFLKCVVGLLFDVSPVGYFVRTA
jgi:DNA replication protein DnaC